MSWVNFSNKILKYIILFLLCLLIFPINLKAAENPKVIFNQLDASGDDYGPGDYKYPQDDIFQNKGNLFDLKSLTIFDLNEKYKFRFSFSRLTDPWGAKFKFSLPLVEVYIDNQDGGSGSLFHEGANVSFKKSFKWDKFLKISGWWVRVFTPESKKENMLNINDFSFNKNFSMEDIKLKKVKNDILLSISKNKLKSLENAKIIVLVGSFDPFGFDHFRSLTREKHYWQIYTSANGDLKKLPRVMDILTPGAKSQKNILKGELPEIPYFKVDINKKDAPPTLVDNLKPVNKISLILVFTYILLLIFVIYKFKYKE